jgi:hypothetical protein
MICYLCPDGLEGTVGNVMQGPSGERISIEPEPPRPDKVTFNGSPDHGR